MSCKAMIALVFMLLSSMELCNARLVAVFDAYRLIQYDISGVPFGSRDARLGHQVVSMNFATDRLYAYVLMIPLRELNLALLKDYITQGEELGGLLFLLPPDLDPLKTVLTELELLLMRSYLPYPVYFAFENEDTNAVLAGVKRSEAADYPTMTTYDYTIGAKTPEPEKIESPTLTNIQGWLPGLKEDGDPSPLPTIAIVASYDTFGTVPALSVGSDSNGSGIVALLEIARIFSLLYANPNTRGRYNLRFALTSGGPYNYSGTREWLSCINHWSIEFGICLSSIGSWDNQLWFHVSETPQNSYMKQTFERFSNVAKEMGFEVGVKHKQINLSNDRVAWEHEQFSRQGIAAATLSGLSVAPEMLESTSGLSDSRYLVKETAIIRSIKLVAESIARHIYGHNIEIIPDKNSMAVNTSYVRSWLDLLSKTPRVAPFLQKNDPFVMALKKELEDHGQEVRVQHEVMDGEFSFYDSIKAELNIHQVMACIYRRLCS